jgi:3-dehydroquinate dehydratase-2
MRRVLMLSGPNLNFLGRRDPALYGRATLRQLERQVARWGAELGLEVRAFQSNHEGALIDQLQKAGAWAEGAIVNPGALGHYSYALHDALVDFARPAIEVHLSQVSEREPWRRVSVIRLACADFVEGLGAEGYRVALTRLAALLPAAAPGGRTVARTAARQRRQPARRGRSGPAGRPRRGTSRS